MGSTDIERRFIQVRTATAEVLEPYGRLLGPGSIGDHHTSPFYDGAVKTSKPAAFMSDDDTCLTLATVQPRPFEIKFLERHHKHTQAFIPLGGKPFVAVFSPPTEGDTPDLDRLEAFRFDGNDGFCMHIGTWHEFPFALDPDTHVIVILRNETNQNLGNIANNEAHGPDLDKTNVPQRTGLTFTLVWDEASSALTF